MKAESQWLAGSPPQRMAQPGSGGYQCSTVIYAVKIWDRHGSRSGATVHSNNTRWWWWWWWWWRKSDDRCLSSVLPALSHSDDQTLTSLYHYTICTQQAGYWHLRADERHGNPPPR